MRHEPEGLTIPPLRRDFIWPSLAKKKKALKKLQSDTIRTMRDLFQRDNPTAPFQMRAQGVTTPHLDDRGPHGNAHLRGCERSQREERPRRCLTRTGSLLRDETASPGGGCGGGVACLWFPEVLGTSHVGLQTHDLFKTLTK